MREPFVSVIIPVTTDVELLRQCVDGLAQQDFGKREVIVVCDSRASDQLPIGKVSEGLRVIRQKHRADLAQLADAGMRAAQGDVRVLLMPYCIPVGTRWISSIVESFEDDKVGAVVSQCIAPYQEEPGVAARLLDCVDPPQRRNTKPAQERQQVVSYLCDAYRASTAVSVGNLRSTVLAGPAQAIETSLKIAEAGYSILLSNSATVTYNAPKSRRRLGAALLQALDYGCSDALLDKWYDVRWLNAGVLAAAFLSLFLLPVAAFSLPIAVVFSIAVFVWAAFLSLRLPVVQWECPLAMANFVAYVGIILLIRDDWRPGPFGSHMHPAIIRQWCWLAAVTGSNLLVVVKAASVSGLYTLRQPRGLLYAVPVFTLGILWWLLTGVGYFWGLFLSPTARRESPKPPE